ncbi:hypothetical protein SUGI_1052560 [Cryptomeria japonica]|nr:hypothetical protein SUGI_1052560 [Cryptomeria japonica]
MTIQVLGSSFSRFIVLPNELCNLFKPATIILRRQFKRPFFRDFDAVKCFVFIFHMFEMQKQALAKRPTL